MRRLLASILTVCALFSAAMVFSCVQHDPDIIVNIFTPTPTGSLATSGLPSATPAPTVAITPEPTPAPSPTPIDAPSEPDYNAFSSCAFVGNSIFEGLKLYGVIKQGAFFTRVGLNVNSVFTEQASSGSGATVINELNSGTYTGVLLLFGENELGWSPSGFITQYEKLVNAVKERQPNSRIYLVGLPPITHAKSQSSTNGVTNEAIATFNGLIADLALRTGCVFVTVPEELIGSDGALVPNASSDGIHLNLEYSRLWADHICLTVMGAFD